MNYDGLPGKYWEERTKQVIELRSKINQRAGPLQARVLPDEDDLGIGEGKRLDMAVMFLDICSFSQRRSVTEEEQDMMLRVLNLFFTEMAKIAEDYGGRIEKNTGDGLMAYFGDVEYPKDQGGTKRAVAASLTDDAVQPVPH